MYSVAHDGPVPIDGWLTLISVYFHVIQIDSVMCVQLYMLFSFKNLMIENYYILTGSNE